MWFGFMQYLLFVMNEEINIRRFPLLSPTLLSLPAVYC